MPKIYQLQTNFTAGEFSELMMGRVDYARYANSVKKLRNCFVNVQGGAQRREGLAYVGNAVGIPSRIIPFVFDSQNAYVLEIAENAIRIYKNRAVVAIITAPYTVLSGLSNIRYTQSASTMILTHPSFPPQRLVRYSDTSWSLSALDYSTPPLQEAGEKPATTLGLSALTGTITVTAGASVFLGADVGRQITAGTGLGTITAQSGTTATVTVLTPFDALSYASGAWTILDSPVASCTPSGIATGASITLTLSVAGWRPTDVGRYVVINKGICRITSFASATVVSATVVIALISTDVQYAGSWRLMTSAFNTTNGYPVAVAMFEGRLVFGGTRAQPNTLWFSKVNDIRNFALGVNASDAMEWQVTSDRQDQIIHLVPTRSLVVHTYSGEFAVYGSDSGPITPTTTIIRLQTTYGSALAAPELIGQTDVFVQRSGRKIRAAGYDVNKDGFVSADVSEVAEHIFRVGVADVAYSAEPVPRIYAVLNDGSWACGTYSQDQSVMAWSLNTSTNGAAISVCTVPNATDGVDDVYFVVVRGIQSSIEVLDDSYYHDQGAIFNTGVEVNQVTSLWLANKTVALTIDGQWAGEVVANGSGVVALPFPGKVINYGLKFVGSMELLPPEFQIDATIQGKQIGVSNIMVRVLNTEALLVNGQQLLNRTLGNSVMNVAMPKVTGDYDTSTSGIAKNGVPVLIEQGNPSPFHVLAVRRTLTVND